MSARWGVGIADVVLGVLVLGIIQTAKDSMLDDPGLGWHLRNIDAMWEAGGWLERDPFSGPRGDQPWRTNQWIGDLVLWLGERWGGLEGIAAVTTLVLAFTFRCLFRMLWADGLAWPMAAFWTFLGAMGTSLSWVARPNVWTILFTLLCARLCVSFHEGRISGRAIWWLVPLLAVWANTHGGFVAGLIILGVTLWVEAALWLLPGQPQTQRFAGVRLRTMAIVSAAAVLGTFANPYGPGLYSFVFGLLGDEFFMNLNTEWHSPNFHEQGAFRYELLILLLPLLLGLAGYRPSLAALGLCVVWLHFALDGRRYVALWVVVTTPLLARLSTDLPRLRPLVGVVPLSAELRQMLGARPRASFGLASWLISLGLLVWARASTDYAGHDPRHIPAAALHHLLRIHEGRTVLHDYNWGGYLTWHGWKAEPRFRNWIDDRNEVQGQAHIESYFSLLFTKPGWEDRLRALEIQVVCIRPDTPLAWRLAERPVWREVYRDDFAVIFEHRPAQVSVDRFH